jgi:hypothetical protein
MDQAAKPPTDDTSVFFIGGPGLVSVTVCAPAALTRSAGPDCAEQGERHERPLLLRHKHPGPSDHHRR